MAFTETPEVDATAFDAPPILAEFDTPPLEEDKIDYDPRLDPNRVEYVVGGKSDGIRFDACSLTNSTGYYSEDFANHS